MPLGAYLHGERSKPYSLVRVLIKSLRFVFMVFALIVRRGRSKQVRQISKARSGPCDFEIRSKRSLGTLHLACSGIEGWSKRSGKSGLWKARSLAAQFISFGEKEDFLLAIALR